MTEKNNKNNLEFFPSPFRSSELIGEEYIIRHQLSSAQGLLDLIAIYLETGFSLVQFVFQFSPTFLAVHNV